jgi:hypothetical protein
MGKMTPKQVALAVELRNSLLDSDETFEDGGLRDHELFRALEFHPEVRVEIARILHERVKVA